MASTPPTPISSSEFARSLADVLNRAAYRDEAFVIERGGRRLVLRAEDSDNTPPRYSKESVLRAFEEFRAKHPEPDLTFGEDIMRARALVDDEVKDPWTR